MNNAHTNVNKFLQKLRLCLNVCAHFSFVERMYLHQVAHTCKLHKVCGRSFAQIEPSNYFTRLYMKIGEHIQPIEHCKSL